MISFIILVWSSVSCLELRTEFCEIWIHIYSLVRKEKAVREPLGGRCMVMEFSPQNLPQNPVLNKVESYNENYNAGSARHLKYFTDLESIFWFCFFMLYDQCWLYAISPLELENLSLDRTQLEFIGAASSRTTRV